MRKPEPVEIVAIAVPLLAEVVVIAFIIAVAGMWLGIWSHEI